MFIYEHQTNLSVTKIMFRLEYPNNIRFTKNINGQLRHIIKRVESTISIAEVTILCDRVAKLDDSFWSIYTIGENS